MKLHESHSLVVPNERIVVVHLLEPVSAGSKKPHLLPRWNFKRLKFNSLFEQISWHESCPVGKWQCPFATGVERKTDQPPRSAHLVFIADLRCVVVTVNPATLPPPIINPLTGRQAEPRRLRGAILESSRSGLTRVSTGPGQDESASSAYHMFSGALFSSGHRFPQDTAESTLGGR